MTSNDMEYLTIALPKGKLFTPSAEILAKIGYTAEGLSEKSPRLHNNPVTAIATHTRNHGNRRRQNQWTRRCDN